MFGSREEMRGFAAQFFAIVVSSGEPYGRQLEIVKELTANIQSQVKPDSGFKTKRNLKPSNVPIPFVGYRNRPFSCLCFHRLWRGNMVQC